MLCAAIKKAYFYIIKIYYDNNNILKRNNKMKIILGYVRLCQTIKSLTGYVKQ
jgi:hypothetical protein